FNKSNAKAKTSKKTSAVSATFIERGPSNVPGRSRAIVVHPTDNDLWYVGTAGGGIWKTADAGSTWSNLTDTQIPNLSTSTLALCSSSPDIMYAGSGEPFGNLDAIGGSGIFKTIDAGATWTQLLETVSYGDVGRLVVNPQDSDHVLIGTTSGIYTTRNGGDSWTQTYDGGSVQDLDATPENFDTLYGSVNSVGIVKSIDGGTTWNLVFDVSSVNNSYNRIETSVSEVNPSVIVTCAYSGTSAAFESPQTDLYISRNSGIDFTNLSSTGIEDRKDLVGGQGWYDNIVLTHPFDENIFYVGGVELFKVTVNPSDETFIATEIAATNQNSNLNQLNTNVHVDQHGLATIKGTGTNFEILLVNDGGIHVSNLDSDPGVIDGDWTDAVVGKNSTQFYSAHKRNGFEHYIAGAQDNGTWVTLSGTTSSSSTFTSVLGGDGFETVWHYDNINDFIVTAQNNIIAKYSLPNAALSPFPEQSEGPFYTKISSVNNNPDVVFTVTSSGVWRSNDFADSWELTTIGDSFGNLGNTSSLNVEPSEANPDVVWAGAAMTESGLYSLFLSQDNGLSFTKVPSFTTTTGSHNLYISGIGTSPTNGNRAYTLFSSSGRAKILKTDDLGQNWEDITGFSEGNDLGFPDVAVYSIIEMPFDENIIWAGTDIGIVETTDGGNSWTLKTDFIPVAVYDMKIVNDQVILATHGRGIWSATITELAGYEPIAYLGVPEIVTLEQESIENTTAIATYQVPSDDIDRVKLFVNDVEVEEITQDFSTGIDYQYTIDNMTEGIFEFGVQAFDDDASINTIITSADGSIIDFDTPTSAVNIQQFSIDDIATLDNTFVISDLDGAITNPALNNIDHPYENTTTYTSYLRKPLLLGNDTNILSYEDIAITEADFDFVYIEGSTDLKTWDILDSYDSNRFSEWKAQDDIIAAGGSATITDDLFRNQQIELSDSYNSGDEVAIRFRLVTDASVTSYGWVIKSITFNDATASVSDVLAGSSIFTIYPSVSSGTFTLYSTRESGKSSMTIFDTTGKTVY
ncbi:hypothetical protein N9V96_04095, partial [Polaribacter sp.]|nr:hypothetical protein [Polaribacter sp.]